MLSIFSPSLPSPPHLFSLLLSPYLPFSLPSSLPPSKSPPCPEWGSYYLLVSHLQLGPMAPASLAAPGSGSLGEYAACSHAALAASGSCSTSHKEQKQTSVTWIWRGKAPSFTAVGSVDLFSHFGKHCGHFSEN